jgi:hypothetical protein
MDGSAFRGVGMLLNGLIIVALVAVPLAIWKLAECIIWLCHHVKVIVQ